MLTTARPTRTAATHAHHIDAPIDTVFSLVADVHNWPRWGPFTDSSAAADIDQPGLPHPIQLGRHQLRVALTTPDAPYWLRYRLTGGPARVLHTAEVTLSPTDDGGTHLHWRATPTRHPPGAARRRTAALDTAVAELAAQLASPLKTRPPPAPSGPTPAPTRPPHAVASRRSRPGTPWLPDAASDTTGCAEDCTPSASCHLPWAAAPAWRAEVCTLRS